MVNVRWSFFFSALGRRDPPDGAFALRWPDIVIFEAEFPVEDLVVADVVAELAPDGRVKGFAEAVFALFGMVLGIELVVLTVFEAVVEALVRVVDADVDFVGVVVGFVVVVVDAVAVVGVVVSLVLGVVVGSVGDVAGSVDSVIGAVVNVVVDVVVVGVGVVLDVVVGSVDLVVVVVCVVRVVEGSVVIFVDGFPLVVVGGSVQVLPKKEQISDGIVQI